MSNKSIILRKVIVLLIIIVLLNSFSVFTTFIHGESTKTNISLQIGNPVMKVNNGELQIDPISIETVPVIVKSRTLLPIRAVIEAIGGQISWNDQYKLIKIEVNGQSIMLFMLNPVYMEEPVYRGVNEGMKTLGLYEGSKTILVNGQEKQNDVPAMIINDRTFMPLRFIAETAGCKVDWNDANKEVAITYHENNTPTEVQGEVMWFKLAETYSEDFPTSLADKEFARIVKEKTNGRINIEVVTTGMLGDEEYAIEKVQGGFIDFARANTFSLTESIPELNVFQLPYIFNGGGHMWRVLESEIGTEILYSNEMSESNLVGLCWYDGGQRSFYATTPLSSMADLAVKNIRVQGSQIMAETVSTIGAIPNPMPFNEVYSALKEGVIDGAENTFLSYLLTHHYEVAPYYICDGHTRIPEILIASKATMDGLTLEDQQAIKEAAWESMYFQRQKWAEESEKAKAELLAAGCTILYPSDEIIKEFQSAVLPLYEKYAPNQKELIDRIYSIQ